MATRWVSANQIAGLLGPTPLAGPAYRDLADRIRLQIVDGRLNQGVRLPSERDLAAALGVSRTTVAAAYARLSDSGYLRALPGSGSYARLPPMARDLVRTAAAEDGVEPIFLTRASAPAPPGLAAFFRRAGEQLPSLLAQDGYLSDGLLSLRERVGERFTARGLPTDPEQLIITSGALSALNVVLRTLVGPGDRVLLESPTYPAAAEAVRRSGARLVGYPLGPAGWRGADLDLLLRQTAPRLAYLIPDFHNPTAATMSGSVRGDVATALQRNRTTSVIDESLVELALEGQPGESALGRLLPDAITIGSASKAFWGGLRIGWIRAPYDLVPALIDTRAAMDLGSAVFEQLVLAELLTDPDQLLADHRDRLRGQRDHLAAELRRALPDWQFSVPDGGLSLWVQLPGEDSTRLAAAGDQHGVILAAGPRFFVGGGGERHLRLPYSADPDTLTEAVRRLAATWRAVQSGRSPARAYGPMGLTA